MAPSARTWDVDIVVGIPFGPCKVNLTRRTCEYPLDDGTGSYPRRLPRDDLLPRVPDRGVPAGRLERVDARVAGGRDARGLARLGRRDVEAARGGGADRA